MNNGNHSPNYGTKMEEGEKALWREESTEGKSSGAGAYSAVVVPSLWSPWVWQCPSWDTVMDRSQGSGHWSWQRIQPHWNRAQEAPGAPGNPACESLTCQPIMCRTQSCTDHAGPVLHTSSWSRDCPNPVSYHLQPAGPAASQSEAGMGLPGP